MRLATAWMIATIAAGIPTAGSAQRVLDRVDPTKVEATTIPLPKAPDDATITLPTPPRSAAQPSRSVTVGAVIIEGLSVLSPGDFADIVESHVGRTLSPAELAGLTDRLAERARSRGYVLATATIAPQAVTAGVLRVTMDEGRIAEVRMAGVDNRAVTAALASLVGDRPVTIAQLERGLLSAGDIDGVWVRRTRLLREGGRNILLVDVVIDSATAWIGLQNDGSLPIGPLQLDATARLSQVLAPDDLLTLSAVVTPVDLREYV